MIDIKSAIVILSNLIIPQRIPYRSHFQTIEHSMNAPAPPFRLTTQRQIIFEELAKVNSHPTAGELYDTVRKRLPRIGLGTVYRNLELMAEHGMISKVEVGGTQKRFDAITDNHYHIRCSVCGRVDDIDVPVIHELVAQAAASSSYFIQGHHVEFTGICGACRQGQSQRLPH